MIKHGVDEDQVVVELLGALPRPMIKRVTPKSAAFAIADGLERRAPRVIHPSRWAIIAAARGVVGPVLDKKLRSAAPYSTSSPTGSTRPTTPDLHTHHSAKENDMTTWKDVPNRNIDVEGVRFVYRELGTDTDVPVVFLHHFTAVLDDWDPRVIDGIAAQHRVIAFDNSGVGGTGSKVPADLEQMGADTIAFIRALGHQKVDLFGFSFGGAWPRSSPCKHPTSYVAWSSPAPGHAAAAGSGRCRSSSAAPTSRRPGSQGCPPLPLLPPQPRGQEGRQRVLRPPRRTSQDRDKPI